MQKGFVFPVIIVIGALIAFGCGKEEEPAEIETAGAGQAVIPPPQEDSGDGGAEVIARVGDETVTRAGVDRKTDQLLKQLQMKSPNQNVEQMRPLAWKRSLEDLINQQLLLQEAQAKGLLADPEDVEDQFSMMKNRFPSPEQFNNQLAAMGLSEEDFRAEIGENVIIDLLLDQEVGHDQTVSKKEVEDYYKNNPDDFRRPLQVHASHILIKADANDSPEQKEAKRQRLLELKKEIEAGADFAEMAKAHSEGPSNSKGGDLGFFGKGQMVKPFEDAAFSLQVGALSDIVETKFGYHLIKLNARQEEKTAPMADVEKAIRNHLQNQKKQEAVGAYLESLRDKGQVEYSEGYDPAEEADETADGEEK